MWGLFVRDFFEVGINKLRKGYDVGDYLFIILMKLVSEVELGGDVWRLYEFIIIFFIVSISYDCKYF